MLKNAIYVGSIKDTDGIWHPVITSPSEDMVSDYMEKMISVIDPEDDEVSVFWTKDYTVELLTLIKDDIPGDYDMDDEENWENQWKTYSMDDEDWMVE